MAEQLNWTVRFKRGKIWTTETRKPKPTTKVDGVEDRLQEKKAKVATLLQLLFSQVLLTS